ncbi:MAG TPA: S-methyl-5-thioribose-1-phosphate isomerase [Gemmatimonadales bacterium]|jgi:methylthioribose-1-phosphate isomerase|nr:S-methyl-5-thioribose-1-phosphate isomerase [Gemmatimonadales bacterium]
MRVAGVPRRAIVEAPGGGAVVIVDQTLLPGRFETVRLTTLEAAAAAIRTMQVRGAPLIGVTAAYGMALGLRDDPSDQGLDRASTVLRATRPTAINLGWAVSWIADLVRPLPPPSRAAAAWAGAGELAEAEVAACEAIGRYGAALLRERLAARGAEGPLNVLTHCNAGWLATVDWGTALAPIYRLHDEGVALHVWVSETRPRNQGLLTAWELGEHGVPHTLVVDNAAGLLLQSGRVDLCLVGTDRTTRAGDVCNKIGTAMKALAAREAGVPFYVAAPSSSIEWGLADPARIPIEERSALEVTGGHPVAAFNPGFDVTPARHVTALITERGVCPPSEAGLAGLFPERMP